MTERENSEPTPREHNLKLRAIYDQIQPNEFELEMDPVILFAFTTLIEKGLRGDFKQNPQVRHVSEKDLFTTNSKNNALNEINRKLQSVEFVNSEKEVSQLLHIHSGLTTPACKAAIDQYAQDFAKGRRLWDHIPNATTVRFSQYLILDMGNPDGEGIFSKDTNKVRDIERELYGAFMDYVEIGFLSEEVDFLKSWKEAFKEKYSEVPYPNLESKPKTEWFPKRMQNQIIPDNIILFKPRKKS